MGDRAVRTAPGIGSRIPPYAASAGKAVLAELSDTLERMAFEPMTAHTVTVARDAIFVARE